MPVGSFAVRAAETEAATHQLLSAQTFRLVFVLLFYLSDRNGVSWKQSKKTKSNSAIHGQ